MNIILKTLMAIGVGAALLLGAATYSHAATVCEKGSLVELVEKLEEAGHSQVIQLNKEMVDTLVAKAGPPPGVEGEFDMFLVTQGSLSAVFIVQDGCIQSRFGPAPTEQINRILGLSEAND